MTKTKVREITIKEGGGTFSFIKGKEKYDFESLATLRKILSKEKAKMLDFIKYKNPKSIYEVSKVLKRPFKAVYEDIKLLEKFGFVTLKKEKTKGRKRLKPVISVEEMIIKLKI